MVTGFTLQTCWLNPDTNDWLECTVNSKCFGLHPLRVNHSSLYTIIVLFFKIPLRFPSTTVAVSHRWNVVLFRCFRDQVGVYHWCFIFSSVVITTIHHLRALVIHLSRQRAEPLPSSFCSSILTNTISGVRPTFFHSLQRWWCCWCCWCWRSLCSAYSAACLIWHPSLSGGCPEFFSQLSSHRLAAIPRSSNSTIFVDDFLAFHAPEMKHQLA